MPTSHLGLVLHVYQHLVLPNCTEWNACKKWELKGVFTLTAKGRQVPYCWLIAGVLPWPHCLLYFWVDTAAPLVVAISFHSVFTESWTALLHCQLPSQTLIQIEWLLVALLQISVSKNALFENNLYIYIFNCGHCGLFETLFKNTQ